MFIRALVVVFFSLFLLVPICGDFNNLLFIVFIGVYVSMAIYINIVLFITLLLDKMFSDLEMKIKADNFSNEFAVNNPLPISRFFLFIFLLCVLILL